jgi:exonuclease VII large subunit
MMTLEEFSNLNTIQKWHHIKAVMDYIEQTELHYSLRRRLNPHHPKAHVDEERIALRKDQYERWAHLKDLYASCRDELSNTQGYADFENCKNILERIFTNELDEALRDVIEQ